MQFMGSQVQEGRRILFAFLVCLICTCVSAGDIPQANDGVRFDYTDGPRGPSRWGDLKPAWSLCKEGRQQSPMLITLDNMVADRRLGKLDATYTSSQCLATSPTMAVKWRFTLWTIVGGYCGGQLSVPATAGRLKINNVVYRPAQMHFHMPSEHKILNYSFPLELHMVHFSRRGRIAVIAWLFKHGKNSQFLAQFIDKLPSSKLPNVQTKIADIKLPKLERSYGRYRGSLTTPPCLENVTWTVMLWNFPSVSENQLQKLKAAMPHENARPSHPFNTRKFRINTV